MDTACFIALSSAADRLSFWFFGYTVNRQRYRFIVEVVNHSYSAALTSAGATPSHLADPSAAGHDIPGLRVTGNEADEFQTFLIVPYLRCLRGERLHLDHCDGDPFHFFKYTPMAQSTQIENRRRIVEPGGGLVRQVGSSIWRFCKHGRLARAIISRIFAPLLPARSALASFVRADLSAFLDAFFGAALAPLAVFRPLGAPFFWMAAFFEATFAGATCAPCSATAAVVLAVSALDMLGSLSALLSAHDD